MFFPTCICDLENLEVLDLSNNEIGEIPSEIYRLRNMREMIIFRNCIKYISPNFGTLSKLKKLDINSNKITYLPSSFCFLNLQYLNIEQNPLLSPPINIIKKGVTAILKFLKEDASVSFQTIAYGPGTEKGIIFRETSFTIQSRNKRGENRQAGGDIFDVQIYELEESSKILEVQMKLKITKGLKLLDKNINNVRKNDLFSSEHSKERNNSHLKRLLSEKTVTQNSRMQRENNNSTSNLELSKKK